MLLLSYSEVHLRQYVELAGLPIRRAGLANGLSLSRALESREGQAR